MVVSTLAGFLIAEVGVGTGDTSYLNMLYNWISEKYISLANEFNWYFARTKTTVILEDGVDEYPLGVGYAFPYSARRLYDSEEILYVPVERINEQGDERDFNDTDDPEIFYISKYDSATGKTSVTFVPTPNVPAAQTGLLVVILYCFIRPVSLGSSDTIPIPSEFLPALSEMVRVHMYEFDTDLDMSQQAQARADKELQKLRALYSNEAVRKKRIMEQMPALPNDVEKV